MALRSVPVRLPPANLADLQLSARCLNPSSFWIRVHWPGTALKFTKNPDHRFTPQTAKYEVLYLARDVTTAALEVFGDRFYNETTVNIAKSEWYSREVSRIILPAVRYADLTNAAMAAAKVDLGSLANSERSVTHAWAEAVMNHPRQFHGLRYLSRFTARPCLAFFYVPGDSSPRVVDTEKFHETRQASMFLRRYEVALV